MKESTGFYALSIFSPKKISLVKDHIDGMFPSDHFPVVAELEIN